MTENNQTSKETIFSLFKDAILGKQRDFTKGSLRKAVFMLAIPMILEMLMESIFALVDIIYVSQVSVNAVATVGLTESVLTLVYAVAIGLSMAATALIARRTGEKDSEGANQNAVQVIFLGVFISIVISIVGILFPKEILQLHWQKY
jgi:Na+-driven multidrug efflux pump